MNSNLTSSLSDFSKGRAAAEPSSKSPRNPFVRNLIATARSWLGKLVSSAVTRVFIIFFVGFAAGMAWQSYGEAARKAIAGSSPHLAWLTPAAAPAGTSAERYKAVSLALATARQSLDKVAAEIGKVQAQDGDAPRRRPAR